MLGRSLESQDSELFTSGTFVLSKENQARLLAKLEVLGDKKAFVILKEVRYHRERRIFAAAENHAFGLQLIFIGWLKNYRIIPKPLTGAPSLHTR